ncbi:MAG TPA: CPBP family intramembrane glutamic endopeptidase, partial [Pyrinomonadaceae bacterium]
GQSRSLAACEIASVAASALVAEWAVIAAVGFSSAWYAVPVALAFALMFYSHRLRGETLREIGWNVSEFWPALRLLAAPMLAGSLALALAGWLWLGSAFRIGGGRAGWAVFGFPVWGLAWGLLQQYVLQGFINRRAQIVFGRGWRSVLLTAAVFALLHLPNPWLTAATFAGGLLWAWVYQRAPNLFALALSHGLMTWVLVSALPDAALRGLRVGFKYFN